MSRYIEAARTAVESALPFLRRQQPARYSHLNDHEGPNGNKEYFGTMHSRTAKLLKTFAIPAAVILGIIVVLSMFARSAFSNSLNRNIPNSAGKEQPGSVLKELTNGKGSKHLVIASFKKQDVSWLKQLPPDWQVLRYYMDDPAPPNGLSVPRNNGREAMAYITYIIDHYDRLPDYVVFTHGHYRSWHQPEPLPHKIRALNLTALDDENYISFRCEDNMGCERLPYLDTLNPNWEGESHLREFWQHIMPHLELPRYISYKCCAQHATTRSAIQAHSKDDWIRMRSPMLRDTEELMEHEKWAKGPPVANEWIFGMFYEKLWHVLLGQGGEYCPSVEVCRQRHFSNAIICDRDMDYTMFEGDMWKDVKCASAFDDVPPDQEANLTQWHHDILGRIAGLRSAKANDLGRVSKRVWPYDVYPPPYVFQREGY